MIYTVTLNPSLDYVVRVNHFQLGNLHRTDSENLYVGGKGINVSTVLKRLGVDSVALGFVAGFTGHEIINHMNHIGISSDFVTASQGVSRINIKLKSDQDMETEINGQGPIITEEELHEFYNKIRQIQDGDILVIAGSVPQNMKGNQYIYHQISDLLKGKKVKLVVDAEGDLLRNTLPNQPFLIKPNHVELENMFHHKLLTEDSLIHCAKLLQKEGAKNVLVSMASKGALLVTEDGSVLRQTAPMGEVINSVGAGDSMIAGFLASIIKDKEKQTSELNCMAYQNALRFGVACGSAAAFSSDLPEADYIYQILEQLK